MTKILNITKTYSDELVHNGYFIVTNNYRLKWASKWTYDHITSKPTYMIDIDKWIQRLENAQ